MPKLRQRLKKSKSVQTLLRRAKEKEPVDLRAIYASVITRLIFGPTIFYAVTFTTLVNFIVDLSDGELFKHAGIKHSVYSSIDKALDLYWYVFILLYFVKEAIPTLDVFVFLFVFRFLGQTLYFITRRHIFFFLFPNIFEFVFFGYVLSLWVPALQVFFEPKTIWFTAFFFTPLILVREWVLHIQKANFSWLLTGRTTMWPKE